MSSFITNDTYDEELEKPELQDELCLIELVDELMSLFRVSSDLADVCETLESFLVKVAAALLHPGVSLLLSLQQLHWPVAFDPYAPQ